MINARQVQENVAAALDLAPRHITITRTGLNPQLRSVRSWGIALGKPFFAKTLLCDPYFVMPRLATPWDDTAANTPRPAHRQIEIEWSTTIKLWRMTGGEHIPTPLGRSVAAKTIVWEDAGGDPLDDLVKRRHWTASRQSLRSALQQAGQWLRGLHERPSRRDVVIDVRELLEGMHEQIRVHDCEDELHVRSAIGALESALAEIDGSELSLAAALTHGDFMLSNLVWNAHLNRVFIVDFENFARAAFSQDLLSMIFDLRSQLLNPLIPKQLLLALEKSFWQGYGPVSKPVLAFVNGVASARVFYFHLPQALDKRIRKGGLSGAAASVYKTFLQPSMLARCQEGL